MDCKGKPNQSIPKEINYRYSLEGLMLGDGLRSLLAADVESNALQRLLLQLCFRKKMRPKREDIRSSDDTDIFIMWPNLNKFQNSETGKLVCNHAGPYGN